jgi:hypothetical protein
MAELRCAAGKHVSKRLSETSRKISAAPSSMAKRADPPRGCPVRHVLVGDSMLPFWPKSALNFPLSILASPAARSKYYGRRCAGTGVLAMRRARAQRRRPPAPPWRWRCRIPGNPSRSHISKGHLRFMDMFLQRPFPDCAAKIYTGQFCAPKVGGAKNFVREKNLSPPGVNYYSIKDLKQKKADAQTRLFQGYRFDVSIRIYCSRRAASATQTPRSSSR